MDITALLFVAFVVIGKLFVKEEDIRKLEEEEIQEIRRENGYGKRTLNR